MVGFLAHRVYLTKFPQAVYKISC